MKLKANMILGAVLLSAVPAFASMGPEAPVPETKHGLSANVAITSDYIWRGTTQTNNSPAIQGGFDYNFDFGGYVGVWASNVDLVDNNSIETDWYTGYNGHIMEDLSYDVGVIGYVYPKDHTNIDYLEAYAGLTYDFATLKVNYAYDVFNTDTYGIYYQLDVEHPIPVVNPSLQGFSVLAHVGYYQFGNEKKVGLDDYFDWGVGVAKSFFKNYKVSVMYTENNLDSEFDPFDNSALVATFSGEFA